MKHPDFSWVDTAFGGPQHRNNVMATGEISARLPAYQTDCYATWHRFLQEYFDHCAASGSTAAYTGSSYADFLPFDFDGDDLAEVLDEVRDFLRVLELTYEIDGLHGIRCYFSGHKGFHILLSSELFGGWEPSPDLHRRLKEIASSIAQDRPAIDMSIYDQNRLLRLPNTRNSKSGSWKIPLHAHELLVNSADFIVNLAAQPRTIQFPAWEDVGRAAPCVELLKKVPTSPTKKKAQQVALFPTGLREGDGRDNHAFLIARYCRDHRVSHSVTLDILKLWDMQQADPLGESLLEKKIESAFSRFVAETEITPDQIKTPADLAGEYQHYINKLKLCKVNLGWPQIDARLRGIAPGEILTIIARSGVGKTAVLQNILRHVALSQDATTLFCSLEQPLAQVFERFAQLATEIPGEEIERNWDNSEQREELVAAVMGNLGTDRTLTCGIEGLSLPQLDEVLDAAEMKINRPVNLLAIDYLGLLDTSNLDKTLYGQVSRAARELKNLAKRRDVAVICLCQVSRTSGDDGSKPLSVHSARESGAIEESADFLLGLYRPDLAGDDELITVQILKNRKGQHGVEFSYTFDKKSLRVIQPELEVVRREY